MFGCSFEMSLEFRCSPDFLTTHEREAADRPSLALLFSVAPLDNTGQFVRTANARVVLIGGQTSSSLFLKKTLVVQRLPLSLSLPLPLSLPPSVQRRSLQTKGSGEEQSWMGSRPGPVNGPSVKRRHCVCVSSECTDLSPPPPWPLPSTHTHTHMHTLPRCHVD